MAINSIKSAKGMRKQRSKHGAFLTIPKAQLRKQQSEEIKLPQLSKWTSLHRVNIFWMQPGFGSSTEHIPAETQMLLWQANGTNHIAIPLCDGDLRASIQGSESGIYLNISGDEHVQQSPDEATLLYIASGKDVHQLCQSAMHDVQAFMGSFNLRTNKNEAEFIDYLAWCTWDAFYKTVDAKKVRAGLKSFRDAGVQLGHMILDDGWQSHDEHDQLTQFQAIDQKFPKGLKALAKMAKQDFGLQSFGVWHAFQGYWRGLSANGSLSKSYRSIKNKGRIRPWEEDDKLLSLHMIHPDDILRFYCDFYRYLSAQGVDMVKVDNQSALEQFSQKKKGRVSTMRAYQEAFQAAGQHFFGGNILHCMCNSSDVAFNMRSSNTWRNSDDYFPKKGTEAQQLHVAMNAYANTWTSTFSVPDWDMFQSHGPDPVFHAVSRAISGGPVYVCDVPGKQDAHILKALGLANGRALRSKQPALICHDRIFVNTLTEGKLLKVFNHNNNIGVLGLFHCRQADGSINDSWSLNDIPIIKQQRAKQFACYSQRSNKLELISKKNHKQAISLERAACEIIHVAAVEQGIAALGLLDKYNSSAAIIYSKHQSDKFICKLSAGSKRIGFYAANKPKKVFINGKAVPASAIRYDKKSGLLLLKSSERNECRIVIKPGKQ